jgi:hypothetical protein
MLTHVLLVSPCISFYGVIMWSYLILPVNLSVNILICIIVLMYSTYYRISSSLVHRRRWTQKIWRRLQRRSTLQTDFVILLELSIDPHLLACYCLNLSDKLTLSFNLVSNRHMHLSCIFVYLIILELSCGNMMWNHIMLLMIWCIVSVSCINHKLLDLQRYT